VELTSLWARRSRAEYDRLKLTTHLWGITQGGVFWPHREKSLEDLVRLDFSGYALGGLGLGEPKTQLFEILDRSAGLLPPAKPRYLMGLGYIEDILEAVERGIDFLTVSCRPEMPGMAPYSPAMAGCLLKTKNMRLTRPRLMTIAAAIPAGIFPGLIFIIFMSGGKSLRLP